MSRKGFKKMTDEDIETMVADINSIDKTFFLYYSKTLRQNKQALSEKYPLSIASRYVVPNIVSESDSCAFCLGESACAKIYPEAEIAAGLHHHEPLISIVVHLSQNEIHVLLTYMLKWYETIGLTQHLAKWFFALFMCLKETVTVSNQELLINLSLKFKTDKSSKTGAELVRLSYLLKCINSVFNFDRYKDIKKLLQYSKLSEKMCS